MYLCVRSKLKPKGMVVRRWCAFEDMFGAEMMQQPWFVTRELVTALVDVLYEMLDHQFGYAFEGHAVNGSTQILLDGAN